MQSQRKRTNLQNEDQSGCGSEPLRVQGLNREMLNSNLSNNSQTMLYLYGSYASCPRRMSEVSARNERREGHRSGGAAMGLSDFGSKIVRIGQDTKNGVQKMSDSVTINNKIQAEKKSLTRLLAMIGEHVYKQDPDHPIPGMEDEYAAVKVAYGNLEKYKQQLNQIKGIVYCPKCGKPAAEGDKFCAKCGTKLPAAETGTAGKVVSDVKEAGEEAGKIASEAADKTGEFLGGAAAGTKNIFSRFSDRAGSLMHRRKAAKEAAADSQELEGMPPVKEENKQEP